jgi:hypothetical protein
MWLLAGAHLLARLALLPVRLYHVTQLIQRPDGFARNFGGIVGETDGCPFDRPQNGEA